MFDPKTILKCMYGREEWRKAGRAHLLQRHLCHGKLKKSYGGTAAAYLCTHDAKRLQEITYRIEIEAFHDGYPFAFALAECYLCETCTFPAPCVFPAKARPSMQALGIDVYATVKKLGLPMKTLKRKDETPDFYGLVLLE
jgi:predicted metal-binding protein